VKRALDVVGASVGLVICAPLMSLVAVALWCSVGRPVVFRQLRPGRGGKLFTLYKFRTMRDPEPGSAPTPDEVRLTRLGRWIRRSSLDELPQFLNVLRGEMSLVGPRPLLPQYVPRYTPEQRRRQDVLPGITGWAQVHGRCAVSWEERLADDVWYVDHWSIALDMRILARTFAQVIRGAGVSPEDRDTMPEFMGTEGPRQ